MTHTPTPWREGETSSNKHAIFSDSQPIAIVEVVGFPLRKGPQATANAAFICRAVNAHDEMLEALREVVRISDRNHVAWDRAKAAIAKASGTQS